MAVFHWSLTQGSPEWYRIRSRIPTSSEFHSVITPVTGQLSAARFKYACRILAGRLLNWQADSLEKVENIEQGRTNEPLAVAALEEIFEIDTRPIGLVTSDDGRFGASPDRVADVAHDGTTVGVVVEAKCPTIPTQMERLLFRDDPKVAGVYKCQRQGHLLIAEADKAVFVSFHPQMPLVRAETGRDEPFLEKMAACLEQFSDELAEWEETARKLGLFQAFSDVRTPFDVERGGVADQEPQQMDPEAELRRWLDPDNPLLQP
jgi:hypothetical protein